MHAIPCDIAFTPAVSLEVLRVLQGMADHISDVTVAFEELASQLETVDIQLAKLHEVRER